MKKKEKTSIGVLHEAVDLDAAVAYYLYHYYRDPKKKVKPLFESEQNALINVPEGVQVFDRGWGPYDHHRPGGNNLGEETSASLVAKELGINNEPAVQELLELVKQTDLGGVTREFSLTDISKALQRSELSNEERLELDIACIKAGLQFKELGLQRDNQKCQKLILEFLESLKEKDEVGEAFEKFRRYFNTLSHKDFKRSFDLVEILSGQEALEFANLGEKAQTPEEATKIATEEATKFVKTLLQYIYEDSVEFFKALDILNDPKQSNLWSKNGINIAAVNDCNNKKISAAARNMGANLIIQRDKKGHTQIYFDSKEVAKLVPDDPDWIPDLVAAVFRLEELLVQNRLTNGQLPEPEYLARADKIDEVPEWHYFKAPALKGVKEPPGRFFQNGSLTTQEVPLSKIPWDTALYLLDSIAIFYKNFRWKKWLVQRTSYYFPPSKKKPV